MAFEGGGGPVIGHPGGWCEGLSKQREPAPSTDREAAGIEGLRLQLTPGHADLHASWGMSLRLVANLNLVLYIVIHDGSVQAEKRQMVPLTLVVDCL